MLEQELENGSKTKFMEYRIKVGREKKGEGEYQRTGVKKNPNGMQAIYKRD